MIREGHIIDFQYKKYFVDRVEYNGPYDSPVIETITLRLIVENDN